MFYKTSLGTCLCYRSLQPNTSICGIFVGSVEEHVLGDLAIVLLDSIVLKIQDTLPPTAIPV
jgi:hypothetical protein